MEFPIPTDTKKLKRLLGFFAHHAKWLHQYSEKIKPLLECMEQKCFPLPSHVISIIKDLKMQIRNAALSSPVANSGPIVLETDASESAIGSALSQDGRPIAFFSRTLSRTEKSHSIVEKEALAIVESFRKFLGLIKAFPTKVLTDQKTVAFLFPNNQSKITN